MKIERRSRYRSAQDQADGTPQVANLSPASSPVPVDVAKIDVMLAFLDRVKAHFGGADDRLTALCEGMQTLKRLAQTDPEEAIRYRLAHSKDLLVIADQLAARIDAVNAQAGPDALDGERLAEASRRILPARAVAPEAPPTRPVIDLGALEAEAQPVLL